MDKYYFYVCHLDKCLNKSKELLDTVHKKLYKTSNCYKYDNMMAQTMKMSLSLMTAHLKMSQMMLQFPHLHLVLWWLQFGIRGKIKLIHDYAVSGWLLCPIKEVFDSAWCANHHGKQWDAMEHLFCKLYLQPGIFEGENSACNAVVNTFWTEFEQFQSWEGVFGGWQSYRTHICGTKCTASNTLSG